MVELLVALAVMMAAMLGYLRSVSESVFLGETNRETAVASDVMRGVIEELQQADFSGLFASYNADATDDPGGAGTGAGPYFDAPGFAARRGDADGRVGEISFPTPAGAPATLTEVPDAPFPYCPRDLDLNGDARGADVTDTYRILPVRVRMEWRGVSGDRVLELATILAEY